MNGTFTIGFISNSITTEFVQYLCYQLKKILLSCFSLQGDSVNCWNCKYLYGVSPRIQSKFGKIRTRIAANTDTFHAMLRAMGIAGIAMLYRNLTQLLSISCTSLKRLECRELFHLYKNNH